MLSSSERNDNPRVGDMFTMGNETLIVNSDYSYTFVKGYRMGQSGGKGSISAGFNYYWKYCGNKVSFKDTHLY